MRKTVILSSRDEMLAAQFQDTENLAVQFSESADVLPDTGCVLISQQFAGAQLADTVLMLSRRGIPCAVLTFDKSDENEEKLLDSGITQMLKLPMSAGLLVKRIDALMKTPELHAPDSGFELFAQMTDTERVNGAYVVPETDFPHIYRYVQRLQERMEKPAQLVKFSFHTRLNMKPEPGTLESAFPIVQKCLRRGDIVSIYGFSLCAILIGADEEGGKGAADRIVSTYAAHFPASLYTMKYEMQEIR